MADDASANETEQPVEEAPKPAARRSAKSSEPTFTKERLIADAALFTEYPSHVMAGALHSDDPEAGDEEMTVADAEAACKAWLEQEV